ncbi:MAG: type II toxin-antitoxin system mRNA interferase toxin, RelE/StbE family [Candidatus Nomurabacteria bacterium]|jgi:addiction module RelE/StbE family toxin|nr:type II toxin-antitoxin system mRNA interferase toxin, RelE/StbE family [Candidatus Nomurabacteria bacterium]
MGQFVITRTKRFGKQFLKQPAKIQKATEQRLKLFAVQPNSPQLRHHQLQGKMQKYYSINITGDIRALYYCDGDTIIIFDLIGSHSQLY